jgi:amino acid transporter
MNNETQLARTLGTPLLVLYGLGTILGAGVYVLIGKVAGSAGLLAPLSFILAAFIAWITALSYSQLVVLFPRSAGEAVYIEKAFSLRWLTICVGLLIIVTGIVSAATMANGFVGYLKVFVPIPDQLAVVLVVVLFAGVAVWGITESMLISGLITLIEIAGLLLVIFLSGDSLSALPEKAGDIFLPVSINEVLAVVSGAFIAFYAFIGFEDMVNVVEEVKDPANVMPKAIRLVIVVATVLYILIAIIAVLSLPIDRLSASTAPLTLLIESGGDFGVKLIAAIGVVAIVNGVLIQIIMAARVVYGMTVQYRGPNFLSYVNPVTKTPVTATVIIAVLVMLFALFFPIVFLAKLTSFIILLVFSAVNFSLWKISKQEKYQSLLRQQQYPLLGLFLCMGLLFFQLASV